MGKKAKNSDRITHQRQLQERCRKRAEASEEPATPAYPSWLVAQKVDPLKATARELRTRVDRGDDDALAELYDCWYDIEDISAQYGLKENVQESMHQFQFILAKIDSIDSIESAKGYRAVVTKSSLKLLVLRKLNPAKPNKAKRASLPTGPHQKRFNALHNISKNEFYRIAANKPVPFTDAEIEKARKKFCAPAEGQLRAKKEVLKRMKAKKNHLQQRSTG